MRANGSIEAKKMKDFNIYFSIEIFSSTNPDVTHDAVNGTAHFEKCNQLLEYQRLLLL
jgi:hypothetical protein